MQPSQISKLQKLHKTSKNMTNHKEKITNTQQLKATLCITTQ